VNDPAFVMAIDTLFVSLSSPPPLKVTKFDPVVLSTAVTTEFVANSPRFVVKMWPICTAAKSCVVVVKKAFPAVPDTRVIVFDTV
jgi:hypothetical protein